MKIASYNSNSISIISGSKNHTGLRFSEKFSSSDIANNSLNPVEKRKAKSIIKTCMSVVYFVSLISSLIVLLT